MTCGADMPDQAYAITFSDGERIYTSQCGLNVTTFLLEYFKLNYDLNQTAARLKPDADGIAMASMQEVLQAHGLAVEARRDVAVDDLRRPLKSGAVVVLPIKAGRDGAARHYLVALYDKSRGYLLVDVPRAVGPLFEQLSDKTLSEPVMLFIRRSERKLNQQVRIEPAQLRLGTFALSEPGGQNPVDRTFRLTNSGATTVAVGLLPSCGCLLPDWNGGFLAAGETRTVHLRTSPGSWGIGRYTRPVFISFPDRSELRLDVVAEAVSAEVLQRLKLSQTSFTIDCTQLGSAGEAFERQANIQFVGQPARLIASSDASWLTSEVTNESPQGARLNLRIAAAPELFADGRNAVEGRIRLAADKKIEPVTLLVKLYRRDFFRLPQAAATVSRSSASSVQVAIEPVEDVAEHLEVLSADCDEQGLDVEASPAENGRVTIALGARSSTALGQTIVRLRLAADNALEATAYLVVNIVD